MENFLDSKINQRKENSLLRVLKTDGAAIDFSSNDYFGFSRSENLKAVMNSFLASHSEIKLGATGSRLLSGNSKLAEQLEKEIAAFHKAEAGLIFNSGYDANVGLLSSVPQKGDTIICDELVHASIIDGARLSFATRFSFKHNNLDHLEQKLKNSKGNIFVVTESVFSMDGDFAPLIELSQLAKKYCANLIVDEAHATGIYGENGRGIINQHDLKKDIFARVITFGKALGCHGAIILGSEKLRTYLINFARSFIYTTALPPHSLIAIKMAYEELSHGNQKETLHKNIAFFKEYTTVIKDYLIPSDSPIQCLIIPGNDNCRQAADTLQSKNLDVRPILSPTVPEGKERLRICLHAFNSEDEIILLSKTLIEICL